jgi:hypothetical protein
VLTYDVMQRDGVDGADLHLDEAVAPKGAAKLHDEGAHERSAPREEDADALAPQPSRGVAERAGGGGVEPLDVVDRDEERALARDRAQCVQDGDADGVGIRIRSLVILLEHERAGEGASLWSRKRGEHPL